MTLAPLGFDFPLMSALSVRPPHAVAPGEWLAEIEEELATRERAYPVFVRERRMAEAEAARHIALFRAIAADFGGAPAPAAFPWDAKIRELRREIALRRNVWPKQIGQRRMDAGKAALRMERMEAVHWRYWIALDHCDEFGQYTADREAQRERVRAYVWRVETWERAAADAGDPAARPEYSTASREAWLVARPDLRANAAAIDAALLDAARRHGFAKLEEAA